MDDVTTNDAFKASYARNRIRSFVHLWYSLFDDRRHGPIGVSNLFAREFEMLTPRGVVSRVEDFHDFYTRAGVGLLASSHHVQACRIRPGAEGIYSVELEIFYQRLGEEQVCTSTMFSVDMELHVAPDRIEMRRYVATPERW